MADLGRRLERAPEAPRILFFHLTEPDVAEAFFAERLPGAPAIADPQAEFYQAFGNARAKVWQLIGPRAIGAAWRAFRKGHRGSKPIGDPLRLSGLHLVRGREIRASLPFRHAGDHSRVDELFDRAVSESHEMANEA